LLIFSTGYSNIYILNALAKINGHILKAFHIFAMIKFKWVPGLTSYII
jgi:hypothetical protein